MLDGFWYPAIRSTEVKGNGMKACLLLGVPLVVGRDGRDRPFALRDTCPHRGIPLSCGQLEGEAVECCYHGWKFHTQTGQCLEIPSLTPGSKLKVDRIFARRFRCEEQDGYFWVYMEDLSASDAPIPAVPRLAVFSTRYHITHLSSDLPSGVDNGIIGLMDPAHGPFVHRSWWWRSRQSIHTKEKIFEAIPNGFRMRAHAPSANSAPYKLLRVYGTPVTTIDFVLPNMRLEQIRCGPYWFSSRATVTPLTAERCRIDFCAAWNIFPWMPFVVPIFRLFAKKFLRQDQLTMEKQAVGLKHDPTLMLIDDADRPAKWYFQLKSAYLESRRSRQPMQHPISQPVTLRWRS